ncbi:MAG TPA: 3-hydroxyacyl-CoA dehydrogenase NAD-binding domain-containing protein [Anaerolineae bacterium]|nr:3-hydroxyacyl-CoA dehydrogenase NAD-binding domain-containing protein [Anaerolineae bacterium]
MNTIAVIGAGTMGRGIAQASALAGYQVILYDVADDYLRSAKDSIAASIDKGVNRGKTDPDVAAKAKKAFKLTMTLRDTTQADLIIEAIPEKLALKRELFQSLEENAPPHTIFASNTSSLSIDAIASATQRPDRFLGLHFFNPAHIMKLVEIIRGSDTSDETTNICLDYIKKLDKQPVLCKDTPAFIVNRVARPFYGEAFRLLGEQVADVADIDKLLKSVGFRMGPFELVDLIGCDVNFAVTQSVYNAYFQDPKYRPHPIQQRMVESNRLGRKTGRGFYNYNS